MPHPLASAEKRSGANSMKAGDRVYYTIDDRYCIADEFLSDGEALVTFDGGVHAIVNWHNLRPTKE